MAKNSTAGIAGLIGAAKQKSTASSSSVPQVQVPDALVPHLNGLVEAIRELKAAKSKKDDAESRLTGFASERRVALSQKAGALFSSVKLTDPKGTAVTYTAPARFKQMKVADGANDTLEAAFGNRFADYFDIVPQIKIRDDITDEQATKLTKALEKSGLLDLVEANPMVKPNKRFAIDFVLDETIAAITKKVRENEGLLEQVVSFSL